MVKNEGYWGEASLTPTTMPGRFQFSANFYRQYASQHSITSGFERQPFADRCGQYCFLPDNP
jgi:hypothetical protein